MRFFVFKNLYRNLRQAGVTRAAAFLAAAGFGVAAGSAPKKGALHGSTHRFRYIDPASLVSKHFGVSFTEGKRLICQGGVKLDGVKLSWCDRVDEDEIKGKTLQLGRRRSVVL